MRRVAAVTKYCKTSVARQYRRMLDVAFAIIGFGVAIAAVFLPFKYPKISKWVIDGGMILGSGLCGAGIALIFASIQNPMTVVASQPASLSPSFQRHLSDSQKACLIENLKDIMKMSPNLLFYYVSGREPDDYAYDFLTVFKAVGFKLMGGYATASNLDSGLVISISNPNKPSVEAIAFENALTSCGLEITIEQADYTSGIDGLDFDFFVSNTPPSN